MSSLANCAHFSSRGCRVSKASLKYFIFVFQFFPTCEQCLLKTSCENIDGRLLFFFAITSWMTTKLLWSSYWAPKTNERLVRWIFRLFLSKHWMDFNFQILKLKDFKRTDPPTRFSSALFSVLWCHSFSLTAESLTRTPALTTPSTISLTSSNPMTQALNLI